MRRVASAVIVTALLACAPVALAADWWTIAQGVDDQSLTADRESLACEQGVCTVWEKTSYLTPRPGGVVYLNDHVQYQCSKALTRTLAEVSLDKDGRQLGTVGGGPSPWLPIRLGSLGFVSMGFACQTLSAEPQGVEAGALVLLGHRYERLQTVLASPSPAPPPPVQSAARAPPIGAWAAQVVSAPTSKGAQSVLDRLDRSLRPKAVSTYVEAAHVGGRISYRGLFTDFARQEGAQVFCARVTAQGGSCFARRWSKP